MCEHCNYQNLLIKAGLEPTAHRLRVMEIVGDSDMPLTAAAIFSAVDQATPINRVTVYRILDLLVHHLVLDKISGARAAHYGLAPNEHHAPHPHFCCTRCGALLCLTPGSLTVNTKNLKDSGAGSVTRIEVLVEGICEACMNQEGSTQMRQTSPVPHSRTAESR